MEKLNAGKPKIGEELGHLVEAGCRVEVGQGKIKTLFDSNGIPMVIIDRKQKEATFLNEYYNTAGETKELGGLIAALNGREFHVIMGEKPQD